MVHGYTFLSTVSSSPSFSTEQEEFWFGPFGAKYTERNSGGDLLQSNIFFWSQVFQIIGPVESVFEIGCNRGLNLDAIKTLLPSCNTVGLEINQAAARECSMNGHNIIEGSILNQKKEDLPLFTSQLSISCGVLIHINPASLPAAYELLYHSSTEFILISEYFSTEPCEVAYRGHSGKIFKRDFAAEMLAMFPLELVSYGFKWRHDPLTPLDDQTWFLLRKSL